MRGHKKNEKTILPDRQTHCCLNSYVLWAVILTELRSALFCIVWTGGFAILDYERVNREWNHRVFTAEELRQLGLHRSLLRSSGYLVTQLDP